MANIALIAGGAGFIGSHMCELLLDKGWQVIAADDLVTGHQDNVGHLLKQASFRLWQQDITEPLTGDLPPLSHVIHLASPASPVDYQTHSVETMMANSVGTHRLLELARRHGARFIFASTSEVYGDPQEHPQTEGYWGHVNPIGPRSCYDEAKRFGEALCLAYQRKFGISVGIARIFNTYGPRMRRNDGRVIPNFITQALAGQPLTIYGTGEQTRSFCYVSDLVDGLYALLAANCAGPLNLGNPGEFTILELAQIILRLTKSRSRLVFMARPQDDPEKRRPDITLAKETLGWEPKVPLEEGIRKTIAWYSASEARARPERA